MNLGPIQKCLRDVTLTSSPRCQSVYAVVGFSLLSYWAAEREVGEGILHLALLINVADGDLD